MTTYHLAQINIARMRYPLDDPRMAGFTNRLDEINALADDAEGFVWRLQTNEGNATDIQVFDDQWIIVNMSVWKSIEALRHYTFKTAHVELLRNRKAWFEHMDSPAVAMWWVSEGYLPTPAEAKEKLALIEQIGASADSFTFAKPFAPDGKPIGK